MIGHSFFIVTALPGLIVLSPRQLVVNRVSHNVSVGSNAPKVLKTFIFLLFVPTTSHMHILSGYDFVKHAVTGSSCVGDDQDWRTLKQV